MKQNKGRELAILNKSKHMKKCFAMLNTDEYIKFISDLKKTTFPQKSILVYTLVLHMPVSNLYKTASNDNVDQSAIRPIV